MPFGRLSGIIGEMKLLDLLTANLFVFDVESAGLHGEAYAAGYVVWNAGQEIERGTFACEPESVRGLTLDHLWISQNVPPIDVNRNSPGAVRQALWDRWMLWKGENTVMAADCAWPVEARFLAACVDENVQPRSFQGPYPMIEISSMLLAAGVDPMDDHERRGDTENPKHHPQKDASQSARLLWEAINVLVRRTP